jgi:hypothetical protein
VCSFCYLCVLIAIVISFSMPWTLLAWNRNIMTMMMNIIYNFLSWPKSPRVITKLCDDLCSLQVFCIASPSQGYRNTIHSTIKIKSSQSSEYHIRNTQKSLFQPDKSPQKQWDTCVTIRLLLIAGSVRGRYSRTPGKKITGLRWNIQEISVWNFRVMFPVP